MTNALNSGESTSVASPIEIRELRADEIDAAAGGFAAFGMAIATAVALQQIPTTGEPQPGRVRTMDRYQKAVTDFVKG